LSIRIGHGYDVHRFKNGRKCILCGIEIPSGFGPDGHSDADVPVHALMDALLGAASLGDIGRFFPDTDKKWKNASSIDMLKSVYDNIKQAGYLLGNADITIVLEAPRLFDYIDKMKKCLAKALETDITKISVKATTEENLGFTGDGSGISSTAVVLLFAKNQKI